MLCYAMLRYAMLCYEATADGLRAVAGAIASDGGRDAMVQVWMICALGGW